MGAPDTSRRRLLRVEIPVLVLMFLRSTELKNYPAYPRISGWKQLGVMHERGNDLFSSIDQYSTTQCREDLQMIE